MQRESIVAVSLGKVSQGAGSLMCSAEHVRERHQEDVVAVFIAHMYGPGTPVVGRATVDELLDDLLSALVCLDQIIDVTSVLVE
jgi:hypothetical protein